MDITSRSVRKQIAFLIGLTLIEGTIIATVVFTIDYFSDNKILFIEMILLWILACLMASGLTFWLVVTKLIKSFF